jgi:hypothetical protein
MSALRDAILASEDLPRERVETPEWGPDVPAVWVRGLTAAERDDYEQGLMERGQDGRPRSVSHVRNIRASLVARTVVDEHGERVFTERDVAALGEKSGAVIDRLWTKARDLSGMRSAEEDEDAVPSRRPDGTSTDSPSPSGSQTLTDSLPASPVRS